jgi:hypothetical protein
MMDSLARLKVSSSPNTTLNLVTLYDKNPYSIDEITNASAVSTHNPHKGTVNMSLVSSTASRIVRQSRLYTPHVHGSTSVAVVNGTLTTNNTNSNVVSRIGMFDDSNDVVGAGAQKTGNGIFFQYDNTSNLALVYRTNASGSQVDTVVRQSSWNVDTLDGNGPSGLTLNVTQPTNFVFEWNQVNKDLQARAGMYGSGITYCHVFSNITPFGNPSLPVRWEIKHDSNLGSANAATMVQGPASIYTDEIYFGPNKVFEYSTGSNYITVNSNTPIPIMSLQLKDDYERAKLYPKDLEIVNLQGGGVGHWNLLLNPTLTSASFSNLGTSFAQVDTSATEVSGGTSIASGYIYDAGVEKIALNDKDVSLLSSISGTQDTLTLSMSSLAGTLNIFASLEWVEKE